MILKTFSPFFFASQKMGKLTNDPHIVNKAKFLWMVNIGWPKCRYSASCKPVRTTNGVITVQ